jgi:Fur family ferric uptake transcriptional regulator
MERKTEQRAAIRKVFKEQGRPLRVQEVFDYARELVPGLGIATVYRNLKALSEEGFLTAVEIPGEAACYELAGMSHHHHFRCRDCKRVFDVRRCPPSIGEMTPQGFTLESHEIILYGMCADCNQETPSPSQKDLAAPASVCHHKSHNH